MSPRETTILVTGADGFVGTHLCRTLCAKYTVYAFMLPKQVAFFKEKWGHQDSTHLKILAGEFTELGQLLSSLPVADYAVHCAGTMLGAKFENYLVSNFDITEQWLAQMPKTVRKLIFLSSQSALGPSDSADNKLLPSATAKPVSFYGQTKLMAEKAVLNSSLPALVFRPAPILGPEDKTFLEIFQTADTGKFPILGQKRKIFQFVCVQDLVRAIETALFSNQKNKIYHIAYPAPADWNQMKAAMENFLGQPLKILFLNPTLTFLYLKFFDIKESLTGKKTNKNVNKMDEMMAPFWVFDTSHFTADTGFTYQYNLNETISLTYRWYQQNSWTRPNLTQ
jgi:nucleoside-diphosphate-sugar epimerase